MRVYLSAIDIWYTKTSTLLSPCSLSTIFEHPKNSYIRFQYFQEQKPFNKATYQKFIYDKENRVQLDVSMSVGVILSKKPFSVLAGFNEVISQLCQLQQKQVQLVKLSTLGISQDAQAMPKPAKQIFSDFRKLETEIYQLCLQKLYWNSYFTLAEGNSSSPVLRFVIKNIFDLFIPQHNNKKYFLQKSESTPDPKTMYKKHMECTITHLGEQKHPLEAKRSKNNLQYLEFAVCSLLSKHHHYFKGNISNVKEKMITPFFTSYQHRNSDILHPSLQLNDCNPTSSLEI